MNNLRQIWGQTADGRLECRWTAPRAQEREAKVEDAFVPRSYPVTADDLRSMARTLGREAASLDNQAADRNPRLNEIHLENFTPAAIEPWVKSGGAQGRFETLKVRVSPGTDNVEVLYGVQNHGQGCKTFYHFEAATPHRTETVTTAITFCDLTLIRDPFEAR